MIIHTESPLLQPRKKLNIFSIEDRLFHFACSDKEFQPLTNDFIIHNGKVVPCAEMKKNIKLTC